MTNAVRHRLHQQGFRFRVLRAYRAQCALCRLRHLELLDAAHIIPDPDPLVEPVVTNGISLCKLHHAAYDSFIVGISPDYKIIVRRDVLDEIDGPMLQHGIQELHERQIIRPHSRAQWPDRGLLDIRFHRFMNR